MKQIDDGLSNKVYITKENKIIKEYISDDFKKVFRNQEDKGLLATNHTFNIINNGLEMDYITHKPWKNSDATLEENIKFIKWLKRNHESAETETIDYPGFERAYFLVLNKPEGKFRKKIRFWPYEEGMVIDALKILYSGERKVLLHNDLVEGNILKLENNEYDLIDFEYCGIGNPIFDVASFLTERKLSFEDQKKIALAYDSKMNLDDLWIVCIFLQAFWARWAMYKYQQTKYPIYNEIANWKIKKFNELVN